MLGVAYCWAACVSVHKHSCKRGDVVFIVVPSVIVFVEGRGTGNLYLMLPAHTHIWYYVHTKHMQVPAWYCQ